MFSEPAKEKISVSFRECSNERFGVCLFFPHLLSFAKFDLNSQIWVGKLKRLSPFLKGNCCTPVHLSPPDLQSCSDRSNSGYF